ncbi:MAG: hypothetical protein KC457_10675 [Myxococcales bacterium]|nr:hypothetical protein [Myxococcales bacterium]
MAEPAEEVAQVAAPEPEPKPDPIPFAGAKQVTVAELLAAIETELPAIAASPAVRRDYEALLADQSKLEDSEELYQDYVRIKVAFEATRDGGLWGLEWDITNQEPRSDRIWEQWLGVESEALTAMAFNGAQGQPPTTAIAECDELSALFAFITQRIGLSRASDVGLFWPGGNHTVAVWTIDARSEHPTRIVVPTTQIFLDEDASLGTHGFNPWKQRKIYDYRRQDAEAELVLPGPLAGAFVQAIRKHGGRSQAELLTLRAERLSSQ